VEHTVRTDHAPFGLSRHLAKGGLRLRRQRTDEYKWQQGRGLSRYQRTLLTVTHSRPKQTTSLIPGGWPVLSIPATKSAFLPESPRLRRRQRVWMGLRSGSHIPYTTNRPWLVNTDTEIFEACPFFFFLNSSLLS